MATETDYARKCQQLDVLIDLLERENKRLQEEKRRWIPITERLPDISKSVLICDIEGDIYLGHRTRYGDYYPDLYNDRVKNVVAWQPLPEPYKEDAE